MYYVEPNKEYSRDVMIANIVNEIKRRTKSSDEDVKEKVEKALGIASDKTSILEKVHTNQLSNIKDFQVVGNTIRIYLRSKLQLSENDKNVILSQVQSIYSRSDLNIESVKFIVENAYNPKSTNRHNNLKGNRIVNLPMSRQDMWGRVRKKLIGIYGEITDHNWFSKLTANINEERREIKLKASTDFVKDWIETNYFDTIENIVNKEQFKISFC